MDQHYIPQFILKRFAIDPLAKKNIKINAFITKYKKWQTLPVAGAAYKINAHSFINENGILDNSFEDKFTAIEDDVSEILRNSIVNRVSVTLQEKKSLSDFIAISVMRVPETMKMSENRLSEQKGHIANFVKIFKERPIEFRNWILDIKNMAKFRPFFADDENFARITPEEFINERTINIIFKELRLRSLFDAHLEKYADMFNEMKFTFLISKQPERFIIADSPVAAERYFFYKGFFGLGFSSEDVKLCLPLTPNIAIYLDKTKGDSEYKDVDIETVKKINIWSLNRQVAWIYSSRRSFPGDEQLR